MKLFTQGLRQTNLNTNDCRKHRQPNSAAKSLYRPLVSACSTCHKPRWDWGHTTNGCVGGTVTSPLKSRRLWLQKCNTATPTNGKFWLHCCTVGGSAARPSICDAKDQSGTSGRHFFALTSWKVVAGCH